MTVLPAYKYGNPEAIAISEESRTCKGCKWLVEYIVFGEKKQICEKNRKKRSAKCYEERLGRVYCQGGK